MGGKILKNLIENKSKDKKGKEKRIRRYAVRRPWRTAVVKGERQIEKRTAHNRFVYATRPMGARPRSVAGAPSLFGWCSRLSAGRRCKEEQKSKHQPRAHAHPTLSFRVGTSYTTGTLYEIF